MLSPGFDLQHDMHKAYNHSTWEAEDQKFKASCGCSSVVKRACLVYTTPWVQIPVLHKPDLVSHTYNPSTEQVEEEESGVGCVQRHSKFEANLRYTRACLKKQFKVIRGYIGILRLTRDR